ncbi:MAG: DUF3102 domain-containing protein [Clostridia bacterium]|nr:DUF3102 domain-containing protein [Clostridia bacterium]
MQNELITKNASAPVREIGVITQEIRQLCQQAQATALMYIVEIGRRLVEAKGALQHGEWGGWLKNEVGFSQSTAENYMRLFEEYGASQITIFGASVDSQTFAKLPYSKALALLAVEREEREKFAEEVGAEDLSVKELKAAIAERDAEKKRNEELEGKLAELDKSRADAEAAAAHVDDLKNRISELEKNLDAEKEATQKAKENLKKAKENPKIPQEKLEAIKKEAEAAAKQEIEESTGKELSELRDKLKAAEEAKTKADKDKAEAERNLAEAEKKLKTASPEVNAFKVMFVAFQEAGNKCRKQIEIIREGDPETAGKLMAAMASFADSISVG